MLLTLVTTFCGVCLDEDKDGCESSSSFLTWPLETLWSQIGMFLNSERLDVLSILVTQSYGKQSLIALLRSPILLQSRRALPRTPCRRAGLIVAVAVPLQELDVGLVYAAAVV